ncbi:MAG: hypothetical protein Q8O10_08090 [candidate division Zixibacteria bacterium]|nr:hypothetical protein [candidate division Zixibacteria bacterium]
MNKKVIFSFFIFLFLFSISFSREIEWHGFVQTNYSFRTTGLVPPLAQGDFLLGDHRFQLKFSGSEKSEFGSFGEAKFFAKTDFFENALKKETGLEIREAYLDYPLKAFDFRIGRQIITWGLGDLLFINDLFPKDWQAFFSGRPMEYLKLGVDGLRISFSSDIFSTELALLPFFESDNYPTSENFFLFDPFLNVSFKQIQKPDSKFENVEEALRLYRTLSNFELSFYLYRGFYRTPSILPDSFPTPSKITYFFPELSVYGFTLQRDLLNGILSLEYGYYDSRQDRRGEDPLIPNSFSKFLIGYQRQGWTDFTYSGQYYGEYMKDYKNYQKSLPPGFPEQDKFRQVLTFRATQLLKYQTLKLSFFGFYSPTDKDYFFIPEVNYRITDNLWVALGGNLFGGEKRTTFLGQLDKNDNLYSILRYEF